MKFIETEILLLESVRLNRIMHFYISEYTYISSLLPSLDLIHSVHIFDIVLYIFLSFFSLGSSVYCVCVHCCHRCHHHHHRPSYIGIDIGIGIGITESQNHVLDTLCREAVRQRKALSRTSSNILLNSVQMGHNTHNFNQYHHINYNNHPSDCDLNSKLKDLKEESSQHSFSNIEVIQFSDYFAVSLLLFCLMVVTCVCVCIYIIIFGWDNNKRTVKESIEWN